MQGRIALVLLFNNAFQQQEEISNLEFSNLKVFRSSVGFNSDEKEIASRAGTAFPTEVFFFSSRWQRFRLL